MNIPIDITRLILEYADEEELAKACLLNKNFSSKICNSSFWIKKIITRFGLTRGEIDKFKGNNTTWAYYKHLVNLEDRDFLLPPGDMERIYNYPDFKNNESFFELEDVPTWVNIPMYKETELYDFIEKIADNYIDDPGLNFFTTRDVSDFKWNVERDINLSQNLRDYISMLVSNLNI